MDNKKINTKAVIIIVVITALGAIAYLDKGLFIAATVNGSPISRFTVIHKLEKASGRSLLDSLITEKLVDKEAKAKNIVVSDEEITGKIKKIEELIVANGGTIAGALAQQNMSMEELKRQVMLEIELEKLVTDKTNITDEEVAQYVKDNAISILPGQEATTVAQIKDQIRNEKINTEGTALIATLKSQAKINYFVNY